MAILPKYVLQSLAGNQKLKNIKKCKSSEHCISLTCRGDPRGRFLHFLHVGSFRRYTNYLYWTFSRFLRGLGGYGCQFWCLSLTFIIALTTLPCYTVMTDESKTNLITLTRNIGQSPTWGRPAPQVRLQRAETILGGSNAARSNATWRMNLRQLTRYAHSWFRARQHSRL